LSQIADAAGEEERALEKLSKIDLPKKAKMLIKKIALICSAIKKIHKDIKITIDPIENRGFNYYSGIGFAIFSSNIKRELGFGGEYVLEVNDNKYKGMGLSILFDGLLKTTNINNKQKRIFVPLNHDSTIPHDLRKNGWITILSYKKNVKEKEEALKFNCSHILKNNIIKEL
jgi:ATP phosphoribosyltransferase regulatory subunit